MKPHVLLAQEQPKIIQYENTLTNKIKFIDFSYYLNNKEMATIW